MNLQQGVWQGQRLVPAAWVAEATARQVDNGPHDNADWAQGYGYQFWRCRHGAYRGDGAFGQYCVVMPDRDAVLAITSGVSDMQAVLDLAWTHLLPAMAPAPLPADHAVQRELEQVLTELVCPLVQGAPDSPTAARVSGQTYRFEENEQQVKSMSLDFADGCTITMRDDRGEHSIVCGHGSWRLQTTTWAPGPPQRVAGSGGWTAEDTYQGVMCGVEGPFRPTLTWRFAGDQVTFDTRMNVGFGELSLPPLVGRAG